MQNLKLDISQQTRTVVYQSQQKKQAEPDDVHFHRGIKKENPWSVMRIFLLFYSSLDSCLI